MGLTVDETVGPWSWSRREGVFCGLLDDRVVHMAPGSNAAAASQLMAPRCAPRFTGYRGSPPLALEAASGRGGLATLARALPEVRELDVNPLLVTPTGVLGLDARVRVGPAKGPAARAAQFVRRRDRCRTAAPEGDLGLCPRATSVPSVRPLGGCVLREGSQ